MSSLLLGLAVFGALGCAHVDPDRARLSREVASATTLASSTEMISEHSVRPEGVPAGVVDLSEAPTVVDEPGDAPTLADHAFSPGTMNAATGPASWVGEDFADPIAQIELRNACPVALDYAFGPSGEPGEADARRVIDGHTIQTQLIPEGHWLHLWDGDRWLGAAMTTTETGHMEIASNCATLDIDVDLPERGATSFSIHWELDGEAGTASDDQLAAAAVVAEDQDQPELWGPEGDDTHVELRLANLCAESVDYVFTSDLADEPEVIASLDGHSERRVEIPTGWWLRYQTLDDGWRGGATTSLPGAVMWISANCVDFGVADGEVLGLGGQLLEE